MVRRTIVFGTLLLTCAVARAASGDIVVAADGSGDVRTVAEAIAKVPENNRRRITIRIRAGTYFEQINIPANKPYVELIGDGAGKTVLSFDINNARAGTTSAAFAFYVAGHDFRASNITFENSFKYKSGQPGSQAVAVLSDADRSIFRNCRFIGWQDTLYAKNGRQFFENCYIEGNVDFIFGQAAAVFKDCEIRSKGDGYIAAPMRFAADEPSGFVFLGSRLTASPDARSVYLARPWRAYGRAVFIDCEIGAHIRPEGWNNWGNPANESTAFFGESGSIGPGSEMAKRAVWAKNLTAEQVRSFLPESFLRGKDGWDPSSSKDEFVERIPPEWRPIAWGDVLKQPPLWYQTDEAARIADQVVLYQSANGGWEKNLDMARVLTEAERKALAAARDVRDTTIDNGTTHSQLAFLARVISGSRQKPTPPANHQKHIDAFLKGLDFLIGMQYDNGGFPQFYPLRKDYSRHITFNDDAMIGALNILRAVSGQSSDFPFVDEPRRGRAAEAVARGVRLILKLQLVDNGIRTVWAPQYDEVTFEPVWARKFEPPCLTAGESVGIVRFLMGVKKPSADVVEAVESAVKWYRKYEIRGFRWESVNGDRQLIRDESAVGLWARFYELRTMRPIFVGRDSAIHYDVIEIEPERRNGYAWYGNWARALLDKDYPAWVKNQERDRR